jgi:hypothetical protein
MSILKLDWDDFLVEDMHELWERPPMWRFHIAQRAMLSPKSNLPKQFKDEYISHITLCLDALRKRHNGRINKLRRYEKVYTAHRIWNDNSLLGGIRWHVEALLLAGATNEELYELFPYKGGPDVFEYYRRLFFDIDSYIGQDALILRNILSVSYENHSTAIKSDLLWKRIALEKGNVKDFMEFIKIYTTKTDPDTQEYIRDIHAQSLMLESVNLSLKASTINERTINTLHLASGIMAIPKDATSDLERAALHEAAGKVMERLDPVLLRSEDKVQVIKGLKQVDNMHHIQKESVRLKEAKDKQAKIALSRYQVPIEESK